MDRLESSSRKKSMNCRRTHFYQRTDLIITLHAQTRRVSGHETITARAEEVLTDEM